MKRLLSGSLAAVVLAAGATGGYAACHGGWRQGRGAGEDCPHAAWTYDGAHCHYTDEDGDGVCDYAGQDRPHAVCAYDGPHCHYTDGDGDGVCDYAGEDCPHTAWAYEGAHCHYTDEDGDGLCDYAGEGCGHEGGFSHGGKHRRR